MAKSKWTVDPAHSSIDFSVRHMMISRVRGTFHNFEASIQADPNDLTSADIEFRIDAASVDTRTGDRDNHLRSADFFNVEKYPTITFKPTQIVKKGEAEYDVTGDLTIRDVTRSETFAVTFEGQTKDPASGVEKVGFSGEGEINRSDYGLTYNAPLETGGVLIGDEVKISLHIEAAKAS